MAVVPNAARLVPQYSSVEGSQAVNVLHFVDIGGDFDQDTGDYILTQWIAFWQTFANAEWTCLGTAAWQNLAVDPPTDLTADATADNGQGSGDAAPASCAVVLSLQAFTGGRSGRGRIYLPGIGDGDLSGSIVPGSVIDVVLDGFALFATDIGSNVGFIPAVYSRTDGVVRGVQSVSVDPVIDSQRRRAQRLAI